VEDTLKAGRGRAVHICTFYSIITLWTELPVVVYAVCKIQNMAEKMIYEYYK